MKKLMIFTAVFLNILLNISSEDNIKKSVVKIYSTNISYSYTQPWQLGTERILTGSGVVLYGKRILTNAHVVTNNSFLQILKSNSTKKYTAKVLYYDHEADLALLTVDDESFFDDAPPVSFGELPNIQDSLLVYGYPMGGEKLSITSGKVNRIEITRYYHSGKDLLTIQIDAPINAGNSGGPVIKDGKIIGIAFQVYRGDNLGYMIPTVIIQHFFDDIKDGKVNGFPALGIEFQKLENKDFKKHLGLSPDSNGIYIIKTYYDSSCFNIIKQGDVLLSIDNISIANDATFLFKDDDRLDLSYLLTKKQIGEPANIKVFRDKKVVDLNIKLKNESYLIKTYQFEKKPNYYIFAGMVFIPLTLDYISGTGGSISKYYSLDKDESLDELVFIQRVLAVDITEGYQKFGSIRVVEINGNKISSLNDLIKKIEATKGEYLIITLEDSQKIILNYKNSIKANNDVLKKYMIPSDRSL